MPAIQNRYEFVYLFDVENGNPNGDPDAGNLPRLDPETSKGLVTDVCLKRKIRNYVEMAKQGGDDCSIYVREKSVLSMNRAPAYESEDIKGLKKEEDKIKAGREWMCKHFYDVRTFGAVMSTKTNNCGQVRGPVQLSFSKSIDQIVPMDVSITRMAVETEKEASDQSGDNRTMGRKSIVPYGLYRCHGFISAPLAEQTGFSDEDLELLWESLKNMLDHDRSAARGEMAARKLIVFKHDNRMGNAPAHVLFDLVNVEREDKEAAAAGTPPRSFKDYIVTIDGDNGPAGVKIMELL